MNDPSRASEESFFDLLAETLKLLDRSVRGQFLAHFFKFFAHVTLSNGDSAAAWDRVLERHRELSEGMTRPVSVKTAMMDVLESMNLLRTPILLEYRELRKLQVNAGTDALTGLYNRRLFEEYFEKELSRAKRAVQQLALVILDLHRFKDVNDRYGHQVGDNALRLAAAAAQETMRASDFAFRIGGDEFAALLPQCDREQCAALSRRLRARYEAAVQELHLDLPLTMDFGIAVYPQDGEQRETLIRLADTRLYDMKNAARPRAKGAEPPGPRDAADVPAAGAPASAASPTDRLEPAPDTGTGEREKIAGRDRRKWERVSLAGTSAHIVCNEGAGTTMPVIDVSYGGLALLVEEPETFPPSLQAVLHMPIQLPVRVSLRKSNEQRINGSGARVGCAFVT